ncbi:MAG: hypothetical protein AB4290_23435 [Spirulina sp.]
MIWLLVISYWLFVVGCWLLVVGYWLFVVGAALSSNRSLTDIDYHGNLLCDRWNCVRIGNKTPTRGRG